MNTIEQTTFAPVQPIYTTTAAADNLAVNDRGATLSKREQKKALKRAHKNQEAFAAADGHVLTTKNLDRVAKYESKALSYERQGKLVKSTKNREKANAVRAKSGIAPVQTYPLSTAVPFANAYPLTATGLPLSAVMGLVPTAVTQPSVAGTAVAPAGTTGLPAY